MALGTIPWLLSRFRHNLAHLPIKTVDAALYRDVHLRESVRNMEPPEFESQAHIRIERNGKWGI